MYTEIESYCKARLSETNTISKDRKKKLEDLAGYIRARIKSKQPVKLIFICTHNSRRSHMSQLWAQAASYYFGISEVHCYSGGTEATAFNPRAVKALRKAGFKITTTDTTKNPVYKVSFADDITIEVFSKRYDSPPNPTEDFCAVMTCSQADESCPFVPGAAFRIALPFDDPKAFDNTDKEELMYDQRCQQIATEMLYVFSKVK
ncbi:MAG: protein-tyrosine-phosphatase [Cytophagaceae bacterium]|nr:protein-tyrosine-phosphatase [Cytophagaceae bacterium]MDW8456021.1 protein-tyrosine-phosphatase [Cytophagaceae bacterium]